MNCKITIFRDFNKPVKSYSLKQILQAIKNGGAKDKVLKIRELVKEGKKKEANDLKQKLLAFTVSGVFEGGRKIENLKELAPYMILDIDNQKAVDIPTLKVKASRIPSTLACFVSPSGNGLKIIVKVNRNLENHKQVFNSLVEYFEKELGVEIDKSGKDIGRLCYFPYDPEIYLNEHPETFQLDPLKEEERILKQAEEVVNEGEVEKDVETKDESTNQSADGILEKILEHTYQVSEYKEGKRNSTVYLFACNCNRYGINKKTVAAFAQKTFDLDDSEIHDSINSAYKNHAEEFKTLEIEQMVQMVQMVSLERSAIDPKKSPLIPKEIYQDLPDLFKCVTGFFDDARSQDVILISALTTLSSILPNVSGLYDRRTIYPNLFSFISAPAGSDKGVAVFGQVLVKKVHNHISIDSALFEQHEIKQLMFEVGVPWAEKPEKPDTTGKYLIIPANSSTAALMGHLKRNGGIGLIFETEADTLTSTLGQDWGSFSDILRKAFQHEPLSLSRKGDNEFIEIDLPKLSVLLTGTPDQVKRLIPSIENGLFSRFLYYSYFKKAGWRDVSPDKNNINLTTEFEILGERVLDVFKKIQNEDFEFQLTAEQWECINKSGEVRLKKHLNISTDSYSAIVYRIGLCQFRIAMILSVFRHYEDNNPSTTIVCTDKDFDIAGKIADTLIQHSFDVMSSISKGKQSPNVLMQKFYDLLPSGNFARKKAGDLGGQLNISQKTVTNYLSSLVDSGFIIKERHGLYTKSS